MKLYIANGTYVGTQAEAKAVTKDFEQVEVPVDKAGLIDYLNGLRMATVAEVEPVVVEHAAPADPVDLPKGFGDPSVPFTVGRLIDLDEAFAAAPIRQQLRLAVVAIDNASVHLPVKNPVGGMPAMVPEQPDGVATVIEDVPEDGSDLV